MDITHHEVFDNTIEFYGKDKTVVISAELSRTNNQWTITNCETGEKSEAAASDDPVSDAHGIIAAVLGSVNVKTVQV